MTSQPIDGATRKSWTLEIATPAAPPSMQKIVWATAENRQSGFAQSERGHRKSILSRLIARIGRIVVRR